MSGSRPAVVDVHLEKGRDQPLRQGHPWVFSGAVQRTSGPEDAPLARVVAADGRPLGTGFWSPRSQIRVRMLTGPPGSHAGPGPAPEEDGGHAARVDRDLFAARLAEARRLRDAVVDPDTTGYRLINAEGDHLPGWTVDRFGEVLVSQITAAGLEALRGEAYAALTAAFPRHTVLQANGVPARRAEGLPADDDETMAGAPPERAPFREDGLHCFADLGGQKTGFYCDQRENRRLAGRLAADRVVLDLFSHTGAFALHALRGGAAAVTCVESSARMVELGREQLAANPSLPAERVEWVRANVFEHLREHGGDHDLVVCDPPPLARHRGAVEKSARAYKDLNRLAFARLRPGGFLLTFSCSGAVDAKLFRQVLFAAAGEAGVRVRLLAPLAAAPDHPVAITHPQGEYLKGWWCEVTG